MKDYDLVRAILSDIQAHQESNELTNLQVRMDVMAIFNQWRYSYLFGDDPEEYVKLWQFAGREEVAEAYREYKKGRSFDNDVSLASVILKEREDKIPKFVDVEDERLYKKWKKIVRELVRAGE